MRAGRKKIRIVGVIIEHKGKILFLRRHPNDKFNPGKIGLPGGSIERGEAYEFAAKRELREETGIVIRNMERLGIFTDVVVFRRILRTRPEVRISDEHSGFFWETPEDALRRNDLMCKYNFDRILKRLIRLKK